jgi:hypothetical protein
MPGQALSELNGRTWSVSARNRLSAFWSIAQCDLPASCWNAKSALTKERTDGHRRTPGNPKVRESRHEQNDRLGEILNDGYGRASHSGKGQPGCGALPTSTSDGDSGGSTATAAATSTFQWSVQSSSLLLPVGQAFQPDSCFIVRLKPALHNRRIPLDTFENTSRRQILQCGASE